MLTPSSNTSCPEFTDLDTPIFGTYNNGTTPYNGPAVTPNPDVSGIGVTLPFPFLLRSEVVP